MSEAETGDYANVVDQVIGLGQPQRVGRFRYLLDGQRWEWSDAVAQMHGYQPGAVAPSTELLLRHKHPDDRDHVALALNRVLRENHSAAGTASSTRTAIPTGSSLSETACSKTMER